MNAKEHVTADATIDESTAAFIAKGEKLVKRYINFDFDDDPFWSHNTATRFCETSMARKSIDEMSSDLIDMERLYFNLDERTDNRVMKKFRDAFIIQMSHDEDVGLQCEKEIAVISENEMDNSDKAVDVIFSSQEKERAHRETKNMFRALRYFQKTLLGIGAGGAPILTEQIILKGHKILMENLLENAGELSKNERITICPIYCKTIIYASPQYVEEVLPGFLDVSNYIAVYLNHRRHREDYGPEFLKTVIKFCAWFFYNIISLHPFGDGNGRMARLLYCYLQSMISPFPVGIYNIFAPTRKRDYLEAISRTRERLFSFFQFSGNRRGIAEGWGMESKPIELATMILECQWYAWCQFKHEMDDGSNDSYESEIHDSQPTPSL